MVTGIGCPQPEEGGLGLPTLECVTGWLESRHFTHLAGLHKSNRPVADWTVESSAFAHILTAESICARKVAYRYLTQRSCHLNVTSWRMPGSADPCLLCA